jgi:hypothetical protein
MPFNNPHLRFGAKTALVTVSGPTPQVVIPAQSGFINRVLSIQATNQTNEVVGVSFFDNATKILPTTFVGPSGTYLNNEPKGGQLYLTRSSGLNVTVAGGGPVEVEASYLCIDEREPLSKAAYRAATYVPPGTYNAVRRPNRRGQQVEG